MKKPILLAVAIIAISTVSCKKERTCSCTYSKTTVTSYTGGGSDTDVTNGSTESTTEKSTKKNFRKNNGCYSTTTKSTDSGTGWTSATTREETCTVK